MAEMQSLRTHLVTELKDLLDAEHQLTTVLKDFAGRASTPALRTAFARHLKETEGQIGRLEQAFDALGEPARTKRCEGIRGLIREGNELVGATTEGALRDAVMITAAQKVEHYEMASYGTARTYAQVLGEPAVARLLAETLQEEKNADAKLTDIAEGKVNERAAQEWHETSSLLLQAATMAGRAAGVGAHTVKRAAQAVGLGRSSARMASQAVVEQVTSSMNRAVDAASDAAGEVAGMARSQVRRLTGSARPAARKRTAARNPSAAGSRPKTKKRARGSRARRNE